MRSPTIRLLTVALAAVLALAGMGLGAPVAQAATGNTIFKVILQPTVVLDYYKEIDLTIPTAAMATLAGGASNSGNVSAISASASGSALTANAALLTTGNSISAVNLDISNAYSVRSIDTPSSGATTVSVSFLGAGGASASTATLTGQIATGSTIGLSNPGTALASFTGTGLAASQVKYGDISMVMDFSNAQAADTYAGATILITATST